jgi:DNA-binding transcriptional ArsR family regulator
MSCCLTFTEEILQTMSAELLLDLPWVSPSGERLGELFIRRGHDDVLSYDDGITLQVRVLNPARYTSPEELLRAAREQTGPGRVVLVAGAVPVEWRAELRKGEVSYIDVGGVVDISWPRLRVSARRFGRPVTRQRSPIALQKGHARVVQELIISTVSGDRPTIGQLADRADVDISTASRAISQLADHGLVAKARTDRHITVDLVDMVEVAERLAAETAWPGGELIPGYAWGRNVWDLAATLSKNAERAAIGLAVTGRTAAAFLGVLGTSSPSQVRCWIDIREHPLTRAANLIGLEPAPDEAANVILSADPWRVGLHHRRPASFEEWTATVAHPVRVWCDLHSEPRGADFAAQLWGALGHG